MPRATKVEQWDDDLRAAMAALIARGVEGVNESDAAFASTVAQRAAAIANAMEHERTERHANKAVAK